MLNKRIILITLGLTTAIIGGYLVAVSGLLKANLKRLASKAIQSLAKGLAKLRML